MYPELFSLDPITFYFLHLPAITLYTYGVLLAASYLLGLWVAMGRAKKRGLDSNRILDLGIYIIIAALIGARDFASQIYDLALLLELVSVGRELVENALDTSEDVNPREQIEAMLPEHLAHQIALEKEGVLFGAGPVSGEDGARKHGMIIVRADSFEQARAIADRDPFHKAGLRSYSVDRWSLNEGSLTFTVNFSDQSVRTA